MKLLQTTTEKVETLETHSSKGKPYKNPRKKIEYQKKEFTVNLPVEIIYSALTENNIEKNIEKIAMFVAALTMSDKEKMAQMLEPDSSHWDYYISDGLKYKFED